MLDSFPLFFLFQGNHWVLVSPAFVNIAWVIELVLDALYLLKCISECSAILFTFL
jgi:hypothetical protein